MRKLKLPEKSGPKRWWLTEIEDKWPYKLAPADIHFVKSGNQKSMKRPTIRRSRTIDLLTAFLIVGGLFLIFRKLHSARRVS